MPLNATVIRTTSLAAAVLVGSWAGAYALPLSRTGPPVAPKPAAMANFVLPAVAFPDAIALLSVPPRFDAALQTERLRARPSADTGALLQTITRTTPAVRRAPAPAVSGKKSDVFDSVALPFKRLAALKRFLPVLQELSDGVEVQCGLGGCSTVKKTAHGASTVVHQSARDRMNLVNAAVNRSIDYRRDLDTYGVVDRWATPGETLSRGQGDCEDFAILKMAALAASGFDLNEMSLVVIFDQKRRFYHAVLSVDVAGKIYILDNLSDQVRLDSQLPNYVALYSIRNGKGYLHGSRDKSKAVASAMQLSDVAPGEGLPLNGG